MTDDFSLDVGTVTEEVTYTWPGGRTKLTNMRWFTLLPLLAATTVGCGTSEVTDAGIPEAGSDSSDAMLLDSAKESGPIDAGLNGCPEGEFVDLSAPADARMITWTFNVSPRCLIIAQGQSVMWMGNLATHPLAPKGGDVPSPIVATSAGSSVSFAFSASGDYGFVCTNHQPMTGVVRVR